MHPLGRPKYGTSSPTDAGEDTEQELSFIVDEKAKWCHHLGRYFVSFIQNLKNLAIPLLGIYSTELKTYVNKKPCTHMFNNIFIHNCPYNWKQPRHPSVAEDRQTAISDCGILFIAKSNELQAMKRYEDPSNVSPMVLGMQLYHIYETLLIFPISF